MRTLYLVNLNSTQYGIWKDEIASITDVQTVHRIPLSPDCIAGVSVIDGRSTALADLGACIGLRDRPVSGPVKVFFVEGKKNDSGFVISGGIEEMDVLPEAVHPLPGYLKTAGNDTCVLHGRRPIPVINLTALYDRIHERSTTPAAPALSVPAARPAVPAEIKEIHLIRAGGEIFAFPGAQVTDRPAPVFPESIAKITLAPRYVKGLAFHQKSVLPVISLAERMGLTARGTEELMTVAELAGARFGFLIDEYLGSVDGTDIRPLPPAASTGWASAAVLYRGAVIPLLDPAVLLAEADREDAVKRLPGRYSPDVRFLDAFERTNVDVTEFSLLGVRHALPKNEVEDVVPFKTYRKVPDSLPIVIGITEHNGEVLPVLDLAMVFGRRSLETPEWKLILVKNGDFRAFVITERLYHERMLPRDIQRKVPIILPHTLVYGCYPEGVAVRLILNVEALTVHFDKSVVRDLLPALTSEMAAAPSELVPSLLPGEHLREGAAASPPETAAQGGRQAGPETEEEQAEDAILARTEAEQLARQEAEIKARAEAEENLRLAREEEHRRQVLEEQARREAEELSRRAEEEARRATAEEQAKRDAEELAREQVEAEAVRAAEEARRRAEEKAVQEARERERAEAEERLKADEERKRIESAERARREAEEETRRESEERERAEAETRRKLEEERRRIAAERAANEAEEEARRAEEEAVRTAAEEKARKDAAEEQARRDAEEKARREAEELSRQAEEESVRRAAEEQARKAAEEQRRIEAARREAAAASQRQAEEQARKAAEEQRKIAETRARREEAEAEAKRVEEERQRSAAAASRDAEKIGKELKREAIPAAGRTFTDRAPAAPPGAVTSSDERDTGQDRQIRKRYIAIAAGLVLVSLLYFGSQRRSPIDLIDEGAARKTEETGQKSGSVEQTDLREPASSGKGPVREGPLVLTVPPDRPIETDIYIVKKGDTLWAICKRFTGNPFNYPRVARDNSIANPDLIFPGQRVHLKK